MRVLFDSDVLLDVGLQRKPWHRASDELVRVARRGVIGGWVAWHSISNIAYLARAREGLHAREFISDLLHFIRVAPVGHRDMELALKLDMSDLEDAMQAAAALACAADRIVTRNSRDFAKSPVRPVSPEELLREIGAAT